VGQKSASTGKRTNPIPVVNVLLKNPIKNEQITNMIIISEFISKVPPGDYD
tara:strand:+ start:6449 stop:6601 length:153 start_codon:yes stop_codon:yes gene_type:complete